LADTVKRGAPVAFTSAAFVQAINEYRLAARVNWNSKRKKITRRDVKAVGYISLSLERLSLSGARIPKQNVSPSAPQNVKRS
jgi:hypothetical protein